MSKRDRAGRSYEDKSSIGWNESWMGDHDGYADTIGSWARRHDDESAKCNWCKVRFGFG